ncbi:MAG: response regulator transcription factor [Chlorobi bacterium]|nr:response regulator transcription factor [Chlorobiota bacterium]
MIEIEEGKNKVKILFVEDDSNLSMVLQDYLEMIGYDVDHGRDGEEGAQLFKSNKYDIAILDIMMPKKDGFTLATEIKEMQPDIPLIFLTAKNQKEDKLEGFNYGCDDYITKPFSTEELNLRIKAILKRCYNQSMSNAPVIEKFDIGVFEFDSTNLTLKSDEGERRLTRKESALLKLLCENKNELLAREVALETVWGENDYFIGRSMDVFIAKLRKYLKADPKVKITNIHGIGFKLEIND